jgi:5'-nucleotidase
MNKRSFIKKSLLSAGLLCLGKYPLSAFAENEADVQQLTILHTNDVHSRVEPFPSGSGDLAGKGGAARRAAMIEQIRKEGQPVLLFDSGDIFQGTPYFNFYHGELEMKLMSEMRYDVGTLGNHDFDAGIEGFAKQLPLANFPFVCSNYDFVDTPLQGRIEPYQIIEKENIRIGVFGLGIELAGLVPSVLTGGTRYLDPIEKANHYAARLRHDLKCDYVVCLSHLGYRYDSDKVSDIVLAQASRNIDLVLGGHTHTRMDKPHTLANLDGRPTVIFQSWWAGLVLGRIDVFFERNRRKNRCATCQPIAIG